MSDTPPDSHNVSENASSSNIPDDTTALHLGPPPISLSASVLISNLPTDTTALLNRVILQSSGQGSSAKVMLKLKPIGSAPLLKQSVYRISGNQKFAALVKFLRKQLKCPPSQSIFCYINNSFAPQMDTPLIDLYDSFQIDGHLMVSYCYTVAFG